MSEAGAIVLEHVSVTFDRWGVTTEALREVNLKLAAPGWTLVSGHNGSGKSTLLGLIAGEVRATKGAVRVLGKNPARLSPHQRTRLIAVARQRPEEGLVAGLTVEEHARLFGMTWSEFRDRLQRLGGANFALIDPLQRRTIDYLSGGERQVLGLGLQLIRSSKILLLDEPFSALDPERFEAFVTITERLAKEKAVVQVTHEPELLRPRADREIVLNRGEARLVELKGDSAL